MRDRFGWPIAWIVAALLVAPCGAAMAQLQTGSLFGIILDSERSPLLARP
ncbi:MAG TPA: hypothetical protein VKM72_33145 [Thermoanaerobaculia bacterium]|nr:hypothetical protein [Thermoanaerobaculia bacterium]